MKKLSLDLDSLEVEAFATHASRIDAHGTVRANGTDKTCQFTCPWPQYSGPIESPCDDYETRICRTLDWRECQTTLSEADTGTVVSGIG